MLPEPIVAGRHYPALDGIRGIAILMVLVFHCSIISEPHTVMEQIYVAVASGGWLGVDLFFVLSGFLITGILLDNHEETGYFRNFYLRRVLRIFPLYYGSIFLWTLISKTTSIETFQHPSSIANFSYWLYLQNWLALFSIEPPAILRHFWSLAIEEQFYLIWPVIILFAARQKIVIKFCVLTILVGILVRSVLVLLDRLEIAFYWTFSRVDALAVGAYLAASLKRYGSFAPVRQAALRLSTCAGAWVIFVMIQQRGFYNLNPVILLVGVFPTIWLFGAILVIALTPPTRGALHRILQSRVLRFFGKISYGIYVFHWPITLHLKKAWPETSAGFWTQQALFFLIVMTSSIVIAFVSFRYFEEPILQFKHKRTDRDFLVVNA